MIVIAVTSLAITLLFAQIAIPAISECVGDSQLHVGSATAVEARLEPGIDSKQITGVPDHLRPFFIVQIRKSGDSRTASSIAADALPAPSDFR